MTERSDYYCYVLFHATTGVPVYVGKGRGKRLASYQNPRPVANPHLQRIREKHGVLPVIVRDGLTEHDAFATEKALIAAIGRTRYGGPLTNCTDGGEGLSGMVFTPEHRARIGTANSLRTASPETLARMSAARKGRPLSDEHRAKLFGLKQSDASRAKRSASHQGKKQSEETKAKKSRALKGRPLTEEAKQRMSIAAQLKIFTSEHRANISAYQKGRPKSPEHVAKIRETKERKKAARLSALLEIDPFS